ncbi:hypothetical protein OSB04_031655 [Centaurea solstitialis]|uniref:Uncharacterized protein n=1 Tax=Centaurea solstitialis TaxID=347529 RepID=A0AA38VXS9_9ASTR|nr:hypothetical protein OSB04_031655 [Centaurea solstitialis]
MGFVVVLIWYDNRWEVSRWRSLDVSGGGDEKSSNIYIGIGCNNKYPFKCTNNKYPIKCANNKYPSNAPTTNTPSNAPTTVDVNNLPWDPSERPKILSYNPNQRDKIR